MQTLLLLLKRLGKSKVHPTFGVMRQSCSAYLLVLIQIYNLFSGFLLFRTPSLQMSDEPNISISRISALSF